WHQNSTKHEIFCVDARRLTGGNIVPRHCVRDFLLEWHAFAVEDTERPHLTSPPVRNVFDWIVNVRINMPTNQLRGDLSAAFVGDEREFRSCRLLQHRRNYFVFAL